MLMYKAYMNNKCNLSEEKKINKATILISLKVMDIARKQVKINF